MTRRFKPILLAFLVLGLSACGEIALHHNLTESEADKVLVLLDRNGIDASKKKNLEGQDISWTIMVSKAESSAARRLLVDNNLPARPELGLSGVYKEKGLIPTPDEQRARFLLALKGEVVNALRKIPGVHEVGVVLNVPQEKELQFGENEVIRPSASVVLRLADPSLMQNDLTEEKVKRFVANAIPDMQPNDVIVIISSVGGTVPTGASLEAEEKYPAPSLEAPVEVIKSQGEGIDVSPGVSGGEGSDTELVEIAGISLDGESVSKFRVYLIIFLCVLILLSAALLLTLFRFSRLRKSNRPRRLEAVPIEGASNQDLLPGGGPPGETGTG